MAVKGVMVVTNVTLVTGVTTVTSVTLCNNCYTIEKGGYHLISSSYDFWQVF
jgi:hypothetical protein